MRVFGRNFAPFHRTHARLFAFAQIHRFAQFLWGAFGQAVLGFATNEPVRRRFNAIVSAYTPVFINERGRERRVSS